MSPRRPVLGGAALLLGLLAGCIEDNPRYCLEDRDCGEAAAPLCHPVGHVCYAGCTVDGDCRDADRVGFSPDAPHCDRQSGHCVASPTRSADGGIDGAEGDARPAGARCSLDGQCQSGFCVADICCDQRCGGPCRSCSTGRCQTLDRDTPCGETVCAAGEQLARACDGQGICEQRPTDCGGYRCNDEGTACLTRCGGADDCLAPAQCVGTQCVSNRALGERCGDNDAACASKHCVDGFCCQQAGCPDCQACDLPDEEGSCQPLAAGAAPEGQCPGDENCGAGRCDGSGACAFLPDTTACSPTSCSARDGTFELVQTFCDGAGQCDDERRSACGFARCDGSPATCRPDCRDHADCVDHSLCDRLAAHLDPDRLGRCVDPDRVITPQSGLAAAIAQTSASQAYVAVPATTHTEALALSSGEVKLIGLGPAARIDPTAGGVAAITVTGQATVQLQGLAISGAVPGLQCASDGATLTVVESIIESNAGLGIDSVDCALTVRRSRVQLNSGGGLHLRDGTHVLVNNLVVSNGALNVSAIGGLRLDGGTLTFANNTVANNSAQTGVDDIAGGVSCIAVDPLYNAIVWGNSADQHSGCTFFGSNVEGGVSGGGDNLDADPRFVDAPDGDYALSTAAPDPSPSIDKGQDSAPGLGSTDLDGNPRAVGDAVDQGALETQ